VCWTVPNVGWDEGQRTPWPKTVLLIGNKGAGKSTVTDRFFHQVLPLSLREKCVLARVDLGEYHGDAKGIVGWAILQLRTLLENGVCACKGK
jgi:predicted kinase